MPGPPRRGINTRGASRREALCSGNKVSGGGQPDSNRHRPESQSVVLPVELWPPSVVLRGRAVAVARPLSVSSPYLAWLFSAKKSPLRKTHLSCQDKCVFLRGEPVAFLRVNRYFRRFKFFVRTPGACRTMAVPDARRPGWSHFPRPLTFDLKCELSAQPFPDRSNQTLLVFSQGHRPRRLLAPQSGCTPQDENPPNYECTIEQATKSIKF